MMDKESASVPLAAVIVPDQAPDATRSTSSRSKTILLNFGSLSAGALVSRIAGLVTNAVLARRVSASGFGITGIAQSVTQYFGLFSDLGLGTVAVREGAQHPEKLQRVISSIQGLRLVLALVAIPLGLFTAPYLPYSEASRNLFRIYLLTLPIQALSVDWVFRSVQKMHFNTVLQIVGALLTFALTVTLVRGPKDLIRVAGISAIVAVVTVALGMRLLRLVGYRARPTFSIRESRYYLGQSLPLCAVAFAVTLYSQANNLILGAVRGDAEVGLYVAATRLAQVCYYPVWLYFAAMAPAMMEAWTLSADKARSLLSTSVRLTAIVSIGCGLIAASASQWILTQIFGKTFNGSGAAFELLVWTGVVIAIGHNWGELCISSKKNRLLIQVTFLGAFVNLAVCAATVSRMGIRGAALSNLMAEIVVHAFLIASFGRHMGLSVLRNATKPVIAGAGAYGLFFAIRWASPPICAILTPLAYITLLFIIGGLTARDLERLRALAPTRRSPEASVF
jgi:O-antigen/teichoic acid export membrane protein